MKRLKLAILRSAPVRSFFSFSKRTILPGFAGASLYEFGKLFLKQIRNTKLNDRSSAATYSFLMAIPPTLLFLFSLVPYLHLEGVQDTINRVIFLITPNTEVEESIKTVVNEFMDNERRDLLSFSIILTIFFSSNGMMGLMRSFDRSLRIYVKRSNLRRRWTAIKLTLMLVIVAILSIATLIVQSNALNGLLLRIFDNVIAIRILSSVIVIAIIFSSISIVYKYGPSLTNKFNFVSPGSIIATLLIICATIVFFFLVNNFINYNKVYGPIGTLIAFMVWIRINTLIILIGYELNVSILLGKTSPADE